MAIDPKTFIRLMKKPGYSQTDCPNFIAYRNLNTYRWYARVIAPLLIITGGGPLFVGNRKKKLFGASMTSIPGWWLRLRFHH